MRLRTICIAAILAVASPSVVLADSLTVHSWSTGHSVSYSYQGGSTRSVNTARLNASLNGEAGAAFCVDLFHYIGRSTYTGTASDPASITVPGLNYAGAAEIAYAWAHNLDDLQTLVGPGTSYREAITGVQSAIWKTLYGDDLALNVGGDSADVMSYVMSQQYSGYGNAVVIDFVNNQDQVFVPTNPVPEPGTWALLALGGLTLLGAAGRREN